MSEARQRLQRVSLVLDQHCNAVPTVGGEPRGKFIVSILLNHILPECCDGEVLDAFFKAIQQESEEWAFAGIDPSKLKAGEWRGVKNPEGKTLVDLLAEQEIEATCDRTRDEQLAFSTKAKTGADLTTASLEEAAELIESPGWPLNLSARIVRDPIPPIRKNQTSYENQDDGIALTCITHPAGESAKYWRSNLQRSSLMKFHMKKPGWLIKQEWKIKLKKVKCCRKEKETKCNPES